MPSEHFGELQKVRVDKLIVQCVVIVVFLLYIVFSPANVTAGWTDQCFLNDFICSTLSW